MWPDVEFFKLNREPADVDRVSVAREVAEESRPFCGCGDGRRAARGGSGAGTRAGALGGTWSARIRQLRCSSRCRINGRAIPAASIARYGRVPGARATNSETRRKPRPGMVAASEPASKRRSFNHHRMVAAFRGRCAAQQEDQGDCSEREYHHQFEIVDIADDGGLHLYHLVERGTSARGPLLERGELSLA
jgi:hypothetical protein